jgi:hypothetical protein
MRTIELGGLGDVDLTTLCYALHLRWEWLARTELERLEGTAFDSKEKVVCAMFEVPTSVVVGNGSQVLF